MRLYRTMQRLPWPTSYVGKVLLLCFIGTHVPLVTLLVWALFGAAVSIPLQVFLVVLIATLVGTAATLASLNSMLAPIILSGKALDGYALTKRMPDLPVEYEDEAGRLMASVQRTLGSLNDKMDELTRIALTDSLTGVRNRRWMNEIGIPEAEQRQRRGETWSLIVVDLDEFKTINDTWGHSLGDQVLMVIADALRAAVRETDVVVRTGGDEFCVLLPGADRAVVHEIASRIQRDAQVAARTLPIDHIVTISVGGATARKSDDSFVSVYRRADRHLYSVKGAGRNAVLTDDRHGAG